MEFHLIRAFFNLSQLVSIKGDLKYELITWVDWTNQNNVEIRYPKLNFNSLLKFNFGYRISTLFQSSHIRSLLIVKQSFLNFKLIRFSWYEHNTYICIYIYIYYVIKYMMSLLFTWNTQWPSYITFSFSRSPTIFSLCILLCFFSYWVGSRFLSELRCLWIPNKSLSTLRSRKYQPMAF